MEGQGGLTAGFGAVHLDHSAAGHTAHAQGQVQPQAAGGNGIHLHGHIGPQLHNGALAELLFDLRQSRLQRVLLAAALLAGGACDGAFLFCHTLLSCRALRRP